MVTAVECSCMWARRLLLFAAAGSVGQIDRKEFQRWIYLRQLMHQQLDRHGKQASEFARLFAALYLACSGRDDHEKEDFAFLMFVALVSNSMGIS